jgi:RNA polymerase sigma-70 factor (ECF subfamily)
MERAWLFTILHNLFRSEYRKRRREVEDVDGLHVDSLKSPPQQHSRLEFEEFCRALEKLLPDQREALISSARQASPTRRPPPSAKRAF